MIYSLNKIIFNSRKNVYALLVIYKAAKKCRGDVKWILMIP